MEARYAWSLDTRARVIIILGISGLGYVRKILRRMEAQSRPWRRFNVKNAIIFRCNTRCRNLSDGRFGKRGRGAKACRYRSVEIEERVRVRFALSFKYEITN